MSQDGERLAPVTYLFGAAPTQVIEERSPSDPSTAVGSAEPSGPVFRDEGAAVGSERVDDLGATTAPIARKTKGQFDPINNVSMHALARRGMSSREMRDYLIGREFDEQHVAVEIERLEGVGLLDDDQLAETLVRTLRDRKGLGKAGLTAELRRRNLDGAAVESAMGSLEDDDELERAIAIAIKRASQLRSFDNETAKRRLGAFLMRRGYSGSVVSAAVARALAPTGGPVFR